MHPFKKILPLFFLLCQCTASKETPSFSFKEPDLFSTKADLRNDIRDDNSHLDAQITYLLSSKQIERALKEIVAKKEQLSNREAVLKQLAYAILKEGSQRSSPEAALLTLYGAALSKRSDALEFLEKGASRQDPYLQLIALRLLADLGDDEADRLIASGLGSPYLFIRLEAAFLLAEKHADQVDLQIETLFTKVPVELKPFFPSLAATEGSERALRLLIKLLHDNDLATRVSALLQIGAHHLDRFIPDVRRLATHSNPIEQEAALMQLGILKDLEAAPLLIPLSSSNQQNVRLAAHTALYQIGKLSPAAFKKALIAENHLFTLPLFSIVPGGEEYLYRYTQSALLVERINGAIALLDKGDERCLPALLEVLIADQRDLAFNKAYSPASTLYYFEPIPSAHARVKDQQREGADFKENTLLFKEHLLQKCLTKLSSRTFFTIARTLFEQRQLDLVPCLVNLIENLNSEEALSFLKEFHNYPGAPLIRTWCNLSLYRLQEKGPYRQNLIEWIAQNKSSQLIQLRPLLPRNPYLEKNITALTAEETTLLLIESLQALVIAKDSQASDILLSTLAEGHPLNRYAIAGLLMRACE